MKKEDQAKSISSKLSKISKYKGINYQNISMVFLIERLLVRLISDAQLAKSLVFKGGYVGLRVYRSERYTVDLDALLVKADVQATMKQTEKAIESDIGDGAWFVLVAQLDLKTQGEYGGIRQIFRAGIGEKPKDIKRAQIINFDVGIGDPVTPGPVKTRTDEMIGTEELSWQVYPVETIVAEKLQTLIVRGNDNSRAKDVFDLHYYLPKVDSKILTEAIKKSFEFRETPVPTAFTDDLSQMDLTMLKRGWKKATASIQKPPTFEEAFDSILEELSRIFPSQTQKKRRVNK